MLIQRLKELRREKSLSQAKLAEILNMSQQAIAKWETGNSTPDPETLSRIANHFNVTTDYLLGRTDIRTSSELIIPEELKGAKIAFHRGEFEDLTQYEVDRLAEFARFIKSQRKDNK